MDARYDLRKFITELPVAQRGAVLSSGRGSLASESADQMIAQCRVMMSTLSVSGSRRGSSSGSNRRIDNVGRLTPETGIESSTRMGSDQIAAEALQEAETEVGVEVRSGWTRGAARVVASPQRSSGSPNRVALAA
ncbi:hypothetical protein [Actinoplanes sp. NBRC 101535]|uniref:hypothetical protein n=1 Tax=Actinoplanes sp. NBRC 101535 TaxID=3032196 RepID=UPI002555E5F1|nr:hypothetical protein [Actinoplanes sp. NBRC 101535]